MQVRLSLVVRHMVGGNGLRETVCSLLGNGALQLCDGGSQMGVGELKEMQTVSQSLSRVLRQ